MDKLPNSTDNYTAIALDLPNILVWIPATQAVPVSKPRLHPGLRDLALDLAKRKPNWQLCCLFSETTERRDNNGSDSRAVHRLAVFQSGEYLGYIRHGYDYGRNEYRYILDTPRLNNSRQRGSYTSTGDVVKARKLVLKHFQPKSIDDAFAETKGKLAAVVSVAQRDTSNTCMYASSRVRSSAFDLVTANWAEFVDRLEGLPDDCKNYPEVHNTARVTEELYALYEDGKGTTIIIRGEHYYLRGTVNGVFEADTIPEHLKRGLGLLKLLDDHTAYPGIGIRLDATRFFVVDEQPKT